MFLGIKFTPINKKKLYFSLSYERFQDSQIKSPKLIHELE